MDLDAILFLCEKLKKDNLTENDVLMINSSIMNGCVDINKSLNELLTTLTEDENTLAIIDFDNQILMNPLFMVLICKPIFEKTIITAIQKKLLTDESLLYMLGELIESLEYLETFETSRILCLIIDIINARGKLGLDEIKDAIIFRKFISDNLHTLKIPKYEKSLGADLTKKLTLIKLLSQGYISLGLVNDTLISYEDIINALIDSKNYGYLRLVLNSKTVAREDVEYVEQLVTSRLKNLYELVSEEEKTTIEQAEKAVLNHLNLIKGMAINRNM